MGITRLFILLLLNHFPYVVRPTSVSILNNCPYTIWPGIKTTVGKADSTGMEVASGAFASFSTSDMWSGKVWGRFNCTEDGGPFVCASGDCGSSKIPCIGNEGTPPISLAELAITSLDSPASYDLSLVNGFNMPLGLIPMAAKGEICRSTSCPIDINALCPKNLAVKDDSGQTIGCKSACLAFNKPEYCCSTPPFLDPDTCKPTKYSKFFKSWCPEAYSYPFDQNNITTFSCGVDTKYLIIFCP